MPEKKYIVRLTAQEREISFSIVLMLTRDGPLAPLAGALLIPSVGLRRCQRIEHLVRLCLHVHDATGSWLRVL